MQCDINQLTLDQIYVIFCFRPVIAQTTKKNTHPFLGKKITKYNTQLPANFGINFETQTLKDFSILLFSKKRHVIPICSPAGVSKSEPKTVATIALGSLFVLSRGCLGEKVGCCVQHFFFFRKKREIFDFMVVFFWGGFVCYKCVLTFRAIDNRYRIKSSG